jgi:hypothetical protein
MNWAWRQKLPPTPKLVLMALADAADDHGVCWPSVTTLARKCSVSPRTVQRMLKVLDEQELLVAESRHRQSGARSSNRYLLQLTGGDNLSPSDTGATTPRQPCQGPMTRVSPLEPPIEPSLNHHNYHWPRQRKQPRQRKTVVVVLHRNWCSQEVSHRQNGTLPNGNWQRSAMGSHNSSPMNSRRDWPRV